MAEDGTGSEDLSPAIMRIPETCFLKKKSLRKDVPHGEKIKKRRGRGLFDQSGSSQGFVGPVFRERLKGTRGGFDGHKLFEFGNPDAFGFEIRLEVARSDGCDVHADTAFFLRETATMDFGSANGLGPSDAALSRHKMDGLK